MMLRLGKRWISGFSMPSSCTRNSPRLPARLPTIFARRSARSKPSPSSLELRTRLGILLLAAKQEAEGEALLKEVLAIDPRQALAHQTLAKFYRLRDKPEPARFHAGELLKIRGGSADEFAKLADE